MEIQSAVPGTVKVWFDPPAHFEGEILPPGPWSTEPNKIQWVDEKTQLPCLIVRGGVGALCGYAGVYPGHLWHGVDYNEVGVGVHGGLTFSDGCGHSEDPAQGVCHIPEPGTSDDVWWLGFDCGHFDDLSPSIDANRIFSTFGVARVYRDVTYVKDEVTKLAAQLFLAGEVQRAVARLEEL